MIKIITGYTPKNEKLKELASKMRLELVLSGKVSDQSYIEVMNAISCKNCKWASHGGIIYGSIPYGCRLPGEKKKAIARIITKMWGRKENVPWSGRILYCTKFEERED